MSAVVSAQHDPAAVAISNVPKQSVCPEVVKDLGCLRVVCPIQAVRRSEQTVTEIIAVATVCVNKSVARGHPKAVRILEAIEIKIVRETDAFPICSVGGRDQASGKPDPATAAVSNAQRLWHRLGLNRLPGVQWVSSQCCGSGGKKG